MERRRFLVTAAAAAAGVVAGNGCSRVRSAPPSDDVLAATAELQSALARGGRITLDAGRHYIVAPAAGALAALTIGSDTSLDLNGAVLELADHCNCSLIATDRKSTTRNVTIANGTISGNRSNQSVVIRASGITPTVFLPKCDKLELRGLSLRDTCFYAIHAEGDDGVAVNLRVDGATGGGLHLAGARWQIDQIDVRDVRFINAELCEGNPFIVRVYDSAIGAVRCENFGFGVKFQDGCSNVTVESITALGGPNNEPHPNPLVKLQGMNDARGRHFNEHIRIKNIVAQGGALSGLYIVYSDDVQIDNYSGRDNCRVAYKNGPYLADVQLLESNNIRFGVLEAQGVRHYGLWADKKAQNVDVQRLNLGAVSRDAKAEVVQSRTITVHRSAFLGFAP